MGFGQQPSSWTLNAADLGDRQVTWPVGAVGQTNSQWKKGEAHSLVPRTNLRSLPSETGVKEIPNNAERNDRNRNLEGATANAPGAELANSSHSHKCIVGSSLQALKQTNITSSATDSASVDRSSKSKLQHQGLQLAIPGQSSYATVTKLLGDMRCDVELAVSTGTGPSVRCKIWGKVKGKSRRIKEGDAVLIAWRLCDSNRSTADILQKYTDAELQKLHMCRIWPHQIVKDSFDWVRSDDQEQAALAQQQQKQEYVCSRDMPSDSSEDSADEEGDDKVTWSMPMSSLALAEDLPSPKLKVRKCEASKAPTCFSIDLELHDRYQRPYNPHYDIILQAYVDWWSASKGTGYAIPVEPSRPKVRLTLEAFLNANMQRLDAGGMISVVIDSRHQFPYSLQIRPPASTEQPGPSRASEQPAPSRASTEQPRPSRSTVTLRAHVNWWSKDKGMGYATPAEPSSLAKGVEVRLTAAAVTAANLSKPLRHGDALMVTIDSGHDRPYALDLKRAK